MPSLRFLGQREANFEQIAGLIEKEFGEPWENMLDLKIINGFPEAPLSATAKP